MSITLVYHTNVDLSSLFYMNYSYKGVQDLSLKVI